MEPTFADIVAKTDDGVVVVDKARRIAFISDRAARLLCLPADASNAQPPVALDDLGSAALVEACERSARDGSFVRTELYHAPTRGWLESRIYPTADSLTIFFADITARKQMEADLREAEARLERAQAVAHVGSWELDLRASEMWASEEAFRIYGLERSTPRLPFAIVRDIPLVDDRPRLDAALRDLISDGRPYDVEFRVRRPNDGLVRVMHSIAEAKRDGAGTVIGVVGTVQDVTERVSVERERARLAAAIDQTSDAVIVQLVDGTISYVNQAFCRLYGYEMSEVLGRNGDEILTTEDGSRRAESAELLGRGEPWAGTVTNRRRDGSTVEVAITLSPVRDGRGEIGSIVQVHRDVSLERLLESRITEVARLEAVGQLAGGVAHDFNNLLTAVRGYAEMLASQGHGFDDQDRADLAQIVGAADRAAALTRQLLAFGRRQVLATRVLDPAEVVNGIVPMLGRLLGEDIAIRVVAPPGLGAVTADPAQLDQVLVNLAVNARDAMPDGGTLTISLAREELAYSHAGSVGAVGPGTCVVLRVSDTGKGMDAATLERMFEPFFTTKEPGRGTGMGLATVHGIVTQSGFALDVESQPGAGTTFRIHLPVAAGPLTEAAAPSTESGRVGNEIVLLVEDEPAVRRFVSRVLTANGYEVMEAADGVSALDLLATTPTRPALLVTDLVMPGLGGRPLADRLREQLPGLRVLFMSGFAERELGAGSELPRDVAFLGKPFSSDELTSAVRRALDGTAAR